MQQKVHTFSFLKWYSMHFYPKGPLKYLTSNVGRPFSRTSGSALNRSKRRDVARFAVWNFVRDFLEIGPLENFVF